MIRQLRAPLAQDGSGRHLLTWLCARMRVRRTVHNFSAERERVGAAGGAAAAVVVVVGFSNKLFRRSSVLCHGRAGVTRRAERSKGAEFCFLPMTN